MKPTVGIVGLTGCAGDQLVILNCERELLDLVELVDLRDFAMASSGADTECALDVAFVEGAVVTGEDEALLRRVRARARTLVSIGTCAMWGGVPAMPGRPRAEMMRAVYGEMEKPDALGDVRAVCDVVAVDAEIPGCPIEKEQFLQVLAGLLHGNLPLLPSYPLCTECRIRENRCLLVADGALCCGPVTVAGCGARCPSVGVACIGCRGPAHDANIPSVTHLFESNGHTRDEIEQRLNAFASPAARARRGIR
ncbi:MAG TPA: hypothetical protein VHB25_03200 [Gemmatimonadaceae bacterium]|nr:hypothetical protein [Gemmatimonadaceae bacterium]